MLCLTSWMKVRRCLGLNVLPKKSTLTEYSARVATEQLDDLMDLWHTQAAKKLPVSSGSLDLDFHTIPHHGTTMEKHFVSSRRQRGVLALVARDASQRALIYASAKASQNNAVITFVDIWKERTGKLPDELVFDSRFTTYPFMEQLNERGILFLTLRKRFPRLLEEISQQPPEAWKKVSLSNIGHQYRTPYVLEARVRIKAYEGELSQLAVRGLGHIKPTILLTNNTQTGSAALIDRYARRMLVENAIEEFINFFHMDALSAAVPLNIDVDLQLTLIGSALYRMLANRLPPPYAKKQSAHVV